MDPPTPAITPPNAVELPVPNVNALAPSVTWLPVTPLRFPIVVPAGVIALISKIAPEAERFTAPVESNDPELDKASVPALTVVPPV
jgi:hypothetical protein